MSAARLVLHVGKEVAVREKFAPNPAAFGEAIGEFSKALKNATNIKYVRAHARAIPSTR